MRAASLYGDVTQRKFTVSISISAQILALQKLFSLPSSSDSPSSIHVWSNTKAISSTDAYTFSCSGLNPVIVTTTSPPTPSPTSMATKAPTVRPSSTPTPKATAAPTIAATQKPSSAPTTSSTKAPSSAPTTKATAKPTSAPTTSSTKAPTEAPTTAATAKPTTSVTVKPTTAVTPKPTASPTTKATSKPSSAPTTSSTPAPPRRRHSHEDSPSLDPNFDGTDYPDDDWDDDYGTDFPTDLPTESSNGTFASGSSVASPSSQFAEFFNGNADTTSLVLAIVIGLAILVGIAGAVWYCYRRSSLCFRAKPASSEPEMKISVTTTFSPPVKSAAYLMPPASRPLPRSPPTRSSGPRSPAVRSAR